MKKLFSLFAAVLFAGSMMAAEEVKATLDFTGTAWNIPTSGTNTEAAQFTDGTYTITLAAATNYKQNSGYLILGKQGSTLTLPAFTWKTTKIRVTGSGGASESVKQNIFVGETAVSTETTGAKNVTNEYAIAAAYQAAGNVYVLKVTSSHNTQITKIEVYGESGDTPAEPVVEYYLVGTMNNWTPATGYKLAANGANAGEYMLKTTFAANDQFKVRKVIDGEVDAWYPDGVDNNYTITEAGKYNVYFRPDGQGGEGWHQGYIYAARILPKTCAEVYNMAKNDEVLLNDLTVTYVSGKNVYVKDATGAMLLYLTADATWQAGDVLSGVEGTLDIYYDLYEVKPTPAQVTAVTATAGTAPEPIEFTAAPVAADMNKYIVMNNVSVAAGEFTTESATNLDLTIGDATVVLRNNFKLAQTFEADKTYNVKGVCAVYNSTVQVYFISAEEYEEPVGPQLNIMAYGLSASEVADGKVTISYSLNAKATAVEIQLLDAEGAVAETFAAPATGLAKGEHSVEIDLADVEAGTYKWAVKATATANNAAEPVQVATVGSGATMSRAVTVDNHYDSPYYGNIYATYGLGGGLYGFNASLEPLFGGEAVATNGWNALSNSSPCAATVGEDGLVFITDWADTKPNVRIFDPATPTADAKAVFGGTAKGTSGLMVNEAGDTIHGSMRYCYPKGTGENTVLYTVDEDYKLGGVTHVYAYNIGTAETPWTAKPSGDGITHAMTSGKWAGTVSNITFVPSKIEGGWWICQHRYEDAANVPVLIHSVDGACNYNSTGAYANANVGYNNQGTFAINNEQSLIVTSTSNTKFYIIVSEVQWEGKVPTVSVKYSIPSGLAGTCLGLGLDEAGNIYAIAPNKPVTIWALPKANNSCITPANSNSLIIIQGEATAIDNSFVPVKVEKIFRNGEVLIIKDGKTYNMMGQIVR